MRVAYFSKDLTLHNEYMLAHINENRLDQCPYIELPQYAKSNSKPAEQNQKGISDPAWFTDLIWLVIVSVFYL